MAGHSKWANIKHRKARQDAVKGKAWSKCSRAIIMASRRGGGDPEFNTTLRFAIEEAKAANMPKDTIEKAIKRGTGDLEGITYEEGRFEGYGPGGVAMIVDCLCDNFTRLVAEIRTLFDRAGGRMGKQGAVSFGFEQKGLFLVEVSKATEEQLMDVALDAGADDIADAGGAWEITCHPTAFHAVGEALASAGIKPDSAELTMLPNSTVDCDAETAAKVLKLIDSLEDHDDVQKVFHNAAIADEIMAKIE